VSLVPAAVFCMRYYYEIKGNYFFILIVESESALFFCFVLKPIYGAVFQAVLLAYFPYFEKMEVGLCDPHAVCCLYPSISHPINF
jgi:hypothetical protein